MMFDSTYMSNSNVKTNLTDSQNFTSLNNFNTQAVFTSWNGMRGEWNEKLYRSFKEKEESM